MRQGGVMESTASKPPRSRLWLALACVPFFFCCVIPVGCNLHGGNRYKMLSESVKQVQPGMTREQVREILGKPDEVHEDRENPIWYYHASYSPFGPYFGVGF